jgi:hypothetical protein
VTFRNALRSLLRERADRQEESAPEPRPYPPAEAARADETQKAAEYAVALLLAQPPELRARLAVKLFADTPTAASPPTAPLPRPATADVWPPPPEKVTVESVAFNAGPQLRVDAAGQCVEPPEKEDSPEGRARLLEILGKDENLSGLSGPTLLDGFRIPPQTIELAIRDGQVSTKAERGLGLTTKFGGAW